MNKCNSWIDLIRLKAISIFRLQVILQVIAGHFVSWFEGANHEQIILIYMFIWSYRSRNFDIIFKIHSELN